MKRILLLSALTISQYVFSEMSFEDIQKGKSKEVQDREKRSICQEIYKRARRNADLYRTTWLPNKRQELVQERKDLFEQALTCCKDEKEFGYVFNSEFYTYLFQEYNKDSDNEWVLRNVLDLLGDYYYPRRNEDCWINLLSVMAEKKEKFFVLLISLEESDIKHVMRNIVERYAQLCSAESRDLSAYEKFIYDMLVFYKKRYNEVLTILNYYSSVFIESLKKNDLLKTYHSSDYGD